MFEKENMMIEFQFNHNSFLIWGIRKKIQLAKLNYSFHCLAK